MLCKRPPNCGSFYLYIINFFQDDDRVQGKGGQGTEALLMDSGRAGSAL